MLERFWSIRREVVAFSAELRSKRATEFALFLKDERKVDTVAFWVDIALHLNELNLKLRGEDNSICQLMTAVRSFQRKLEVFKVDLQGHCSHLAAVQEQVQGQRDVPFVDFAEKLIVNFRKRFDSTSSGQMLDLSRCNWLISKQMWP